MGLFNRRRQKSEGSPDLEKLMFQFQREKAQKATEQQAILSRIGRTTDPLADLALQRAEVMSDDEKSVFMRSVFRQLVLQTLDHTYDDYEDRRQNFERDVNSLGYSGLMGYGTGMVYGNIADDSWREAVLDRSMPYLEQSELPLETSS